MLLNKHYCGTESMGDMIVIEGTKIVKPSYRGASAKGLTIEEK